MRLERHYVRFGDIAVPHGRLTPLLGEHTWRVLQEAGCPESSIAEFRA